jgi:cytoplasmic iron level regulating protein YaaA (DUF328/UPF0246 family)
MLILLPPSEKKRTPESGIPFSMADLSFSQTLSTARMIQVANHPSLLTAATAPAIEIYSGVLYQALDWKSLSPIQQRLGQKQIVIISALFGALRPLDRIPTYKMKIKKSTWADSIGTCLEALNEAIIIDCRSSTYASVWKPPAINTVGIRVFQERHGKREVITHMSKKYRGEVTRALLKLKGEPNTVEKIFEHLAKEFNAELVTPAHKKSWFINIITN